MAHYAFNISLSRKKMVYYNVIPNLTLKWGWEEGGCGGRREGGRGNWFLKEFSG